MATIASAPPADVVPPAPDHHGKRCAILARETPHLAFIVHQYEGELAGYFDLIVFDRGSGTGLALPTIHGDELRLIEV